MEKELAKHGVSPADGTCFVLGGSGRAETVYSDCLEELAQRGLVPQKLDVLGIYHRKFMFDPSQGYLRLYKRELYKNRAVDSRGEKTCFHDRRERIATGASMLFRNTRLLDALQERILPDLIERRVDRCHVWCAGCSNGMEVYSIAMVALHHLEAHGASIALRVLGTDISDQALEELRAGIYPVGERTRQTYGPLLERYTEDGGRHQLRMNDDVRAVVRFMRKDILEGSRRHRFELVVCDHVLQYYEDKDQRLYLERLVQAVDADSWLYVSTPLTAVRDAITRQYPFRALARNLYQRVSE
jgi:chemotaxis methyl-accepting protein methylase